MGYKQESYFIPDFKTSALKNIHHQKCSSLLKGHSRI